MTQWPMQGAPPPLKILNILNIIRPSVQYEQAHVWHLKTRLLWVGGAHQPWQEIHLGESFNFEPTFGHV
jgi:hypothetical protein